MEPKIPKILIAEDELSLRTILKKLFTKKGYEVETAADGEVALKKLREDPYSVAVLDIKMPSRSGLEILEVVKKEKIPTAVIVMTAQDTMNNAVAAMKQGAYDYVAKPFELEELEIVVAKALEAQRLSEEVRSLRQEVGARIDQEAKIVGGSRVVREIYKTIGKVAANDVSILITGESGTGKELIARAIHQHSPRSEQPFIAVNCAAIPRDLLESELFGYRKGAFTGAEENRPGYFEAANRGTLFLDEIGDMPMNLQAKLLRVLQEKEVQRLGSAETKAVDVRIIAATNQNIDRMVQERKFREDLFFRLNVIPISLPPLRERKEDIPLLCEHFLKRLAHEVGGQPKRITPEGRKLLEKYRWPGNIRELENVLKRTAILNSGDMLDAGDFDPLLGKNAETTVKEIEEMGLEALIEAKLKIFLNRLSDMEMTDLYTTIIEMAERPLLKLILGKTGYNQIKAAKVLGINRNTLRKKIRGLKIASKGSL